jgi:hypothetical protein
MPTDAPVFRGVVVMNHGPITIGGIPLPSDAPLFVAIVGVHVAAGLTCVITGIVAMLSVKGPGRHPRFGIYYYRGLWVVFLTMTVLSALRWADDYHLFILGALSFAAAFVGRRFAPSRSNGRIRIHVTCMGLSYILLLTAFYVDNGKNLPLWRSLPPITYWVIPFIVGVPLIVRALLHHPLLRATTADGSRAG